MVIKIVIDLKEASKLLEFVKRMTPEMEQGIMEGMVGLMWIQMFFLTFGTKKSTKRWKRALVRV